MIPATTQQSKASRDFFYIQFARYIYLFAHPPARQAWPFFTICGFAFCFICRFPPQSSVGCGLPFIWWPFAMADVAKEFNICILKIPRQNSQYSTASSRGFRFNQARLVYSAFHFLRFRPKETSRTV
jgi:hypothetical protein